MKGKYFQIRIIKGNGYIVDNYEDQYGNGWELVSEYKDGNLIEQHWKFSGPLVWIRASNNTSDSNDFNLIIYPIPTSGRINIESNSKEITSFSIYDMNGVAVVPNMIINDSNTSIDLGNIPSGQYIIETEIENNKQYKLISLIK